jgi:hypothetical protein
MMGNGDGILDRDGEKRWAERCALHWTELKETVLNFFMGRQDFGGFLEA